MMYLNTLFPDSRISCGFNKTILICYNEVDNINQSNIYKNISKYAIILQGPSLASTIQLLINQKTEINVSTIAIMHKIFSTVDIPALSLFFIEMIFFM